MGSRDFSRALISGSAGLPPLALWSVMTGSILRGAARVAGAGGGGERWGQGGGAAYRVAGAGGGGGGKGVRGREQSGV